MDSREMQESVEIELRQFDLDYETKGKLESKEIFYYLSRYERDYVQEIYNSGVDRNEENKKKLGKLLVSTEITTGITPGIYYPQSFDVEMPENVLYVINERALVTFDSIVIDNLYVKPISYDEYSVNKDNPFRKSTDEKCLRLEGSDKHTILLPSEGVNVLDKIYLDYISTPLGVNLSQNCELHESVHYNVIKGAVKLILAAQQAQVGYNIQSIEEKENK